MEGVALEKAIEILSARCEKISEVEEIPLLEGVGRVAAEDFFAKFDNPPFNRSPLDGYTFNSAETEGASLENPAKFKIIGEECAGDFFDGEIKRGETLRIMTGAAIPRGCDCVIRQEDVKIDGENIFVPYELHHHENFCFAGEDIKADTLLIKKNSRLTAAHIAVFASQGISKIKVYRRPKVAVASTGDELLELDEKISAGKIYNSNLYLLAARLIELDFEPIILGILPDDADKAVEKISAVADEIDLMITTGGVSVGKKDIMHSVVAKIGEKIFWRVLIKPGAPVIGWHCKNFLGIALSGNPFAALATFELIARPILAKLSRREEILYKRGKGVLANDFPKKSYGRRFIRAKLEDGKIFLPSRHESGSLFSAVDCNCLVDIPAGSNALRAAERVDVVLL